MTVDFWPTGNTGVALFELQGATSTNGPWVKHAETDAANRFFRVLVSPAK